MLFKNYFNLHIIKKTNLLYQNFIYKIIHINSLELTNFLIDEGKFYDFIYGKLDKSIKMR